MAWRWQWGCAFVNTRPRGRIGTKTQKGATVAPFGHAVQNSSTGGWQGVVVTPCCSDLKFGGWGLVVCYNSGGWSCSPADLAPLLPLLLFSTLSHPLSSHSHPSLQHPGKLPRCPSFAVGVGTGREDKGGHFGQSFKLRPFSITIVILIITHSMGYLKS